MINYESPVFFVSTGHQNGQMFLNLVLSTPNFDLFLYADLER
jgi:hypothetical protein